VDVIGDILEEHMGKMRVYMVSPSQRVRSGAEWTWSGGLDEMS